MKKTKAELKIDNSRLRNALRRLIASHGDYTHGHSRDFKDGMPDLQWSVAIEKEALIALEETE